MLLLPNLMNTFGFWPSRWKNHIHTTVSWGNNSTISILLNHNFLANSLSSDNGEHLANLHPAKYFPVISATSSDTEQ